MSTKMQSKSKMFGAKTIANDLPAQKVLMSHATPIIEGIMEQLPASWTRTPRYFSGAVPSEVAGAVQNVSVHKSRSIHTIHHPHAPHHRPNLFKSGVRR